VIRSAGFGPHSAKRQGSGCSATVRQPWKMEQVAVQRDLRSGVCSRENE
jgi:hypothetical protein